MRIQSSMKERKNWTEEEDRVLKLLIEERGMSKWSLISETMQKEFQLSGRNGKQCRERYHNHLDKNISNNEWTPEEEEQLFRLQEKYGNKWALISSKLPGRTDNCVKNHFYSKLRKSLRRLNKQIHRYLKREYKQVKTNTLYKIIETMQNRNKMGNVPQQTDGLCRKIKDQLRQYEDFPQFENQQEEIKFIRNLLEDFTCFDKDIKKAKKGTLKNNGKLDEEEEYAPSLKSHSNIQLSTKSLYDDEESSYSNSDIFSSSSFDHRSFCSNRSLRPREDFLTCRSHSIASEEQQQSNLEDHKVLYKSVRLPLPKLKPPKPQSNFLSASLTLPPSQQKLVEKQVIKRLSSESCDSKSSSNKSQQMNNEISNQNQMIIRYMLEGEQHFAISLLSPKQLTIEEKIQMDREQDDLFYGESMEIEDHCLVKNFQNMTLNGIPKLGHSMDI